MKKIITSLIVSTLSMSSLYGAYSDNGTDYKKAKQDFRTKIDALEPFSTINQIICFTQHLRPELMVNKGVYSALINDKTCSTQMSTDQKSKDDYILAKVERADDTSSQIMNIWITEDNQDDVKVRMEVINEPSDTNPIGQFNITWQLFDQSEASLGKGELKTVSLDSGNIGLTMFIDYDDSKSSISIDKKPDGSQGLALTKDKTNDTYAMAWKGSFVNLKKNTEKTCKDKTQFNREVWSYGVYKKADGSSLNINTGFPFEATKDGKTIDGYLGHWGIWI